ncbi:MAG: hydroxyacid dehydrogenase [Proteobacteria bacterium]|nr:hydroxyacid dehydrogenase [Pseudomonadota bacterium]
MATIVIAEFMDEGVIRDALGDHDVCYDPALVDRPDALLAALAEAQALIVRNRTQVRGAVLAAARDLLVVGRLGVGLDNIDLPACAARGIAVYPATGANDVAVADYVLAAALLLSRGAYNASADVIAGAWPRTALIGREIAAKQLGLVGYGAIAREVAKRAASFGMSIVACDPYVPAGDAAWTPGWGRVERTRLPELLAGSDIVSLHVPLSGETVGLIDAAAIGAMKHGAILINAARGEIIDERTLARALKAGHLGGAALDVFAHEPLAAEQAQILAGCPNLILTPHIAGLTQESNLRVSRLVAARVRDHLAGA